jgi:hypothetical protein
MSNASSRRAFLEAVAAGVVTTAMSPLVAAESLAETRGIVLMTSDMSIDNWPERCAKAGVNTIGLHGNQDLDQLLGFVRSDRGQDFLARCRQLNVAVEYELHALSDLLPRSLFRDDPTLFRVDENGDRNPDVNCNPFSTRALEIIAENAVKLAGDLRPTTSRYFYWTDDGARGDCSPEGKTLSASEQALLVENHILAALRRHVDPEATLAHLCYHYTLSAPRKVQPAEGMFLEFAPITRDYTSSIAESSARTKSPGPPHPDPVTNGGYWDALQQNLAVFPRDTAQVLEYWLDASLFSLWKRPAQKLVWRNDVYRADLAAYRQAGLRHFTTFGVYLDAEYIQLHGEIEPVLTAYGGIFSDP